MSKNENSQYQVVFQIDNDFSAGPRAKVHPTLPAGFYQVKYDPRYDQVTFVGMKPTHDSLVDLPDTEYDDICRDIDLFLTPECAARFREMGFLYKYNAFMHGKPGTGKTCIVNRVSQKIVAAGGVVLFNPPTKSLATVYKILDAIQPETRVLVILEEFEEIARRDEETLLHILDGEIQKENAMYIATTNYVHKVPGRLLRPGRFNTVIEVKPPKLSARQFYLNSKLNDEVLAQQIAERTEGFTIDELRDVVRATFCLKKDLDVVIARYSKGDRTATPKAINNDEDEPVDLDYGDDDDDDDDAEMKPTIFITKGER